MLLKMLAVISTANVCRRENKLLEEANTYYVRMSYYNSIYKLLSLFSATIKLRDQTYSNFSKIPSKS